MKFSLIQGVMNFEWNHVEKILMIFFFRTFTIFFFFARMKSVGDFWDGSKIDKIFSFLIKLWKQIDCILNDNLTVGCHNVIEFLILIVGGFWRMVVESERLRVSWLDFFLNSILMLGGWSEIFSYRLQKLRNQNLSNLWVQILENYMIFNN